MDADGAEGTTRIPRATCWLTVLCVFAAASSGLWADQVNPYERVLVKKTTPARWDFEKGADDWRAAHDARIVAGEGVLRITSTGSDPYVYAPPVEVPGPVSVQLRMRAQGSGGGQFFWTTRESPRWGTDKATPGFDISHDGEWHTYTVEILADGTVTRLRLDPGAGPGTIELDEVRLTKCIWHPLEIERVEAGPDKVTVHVRNHGTDTVYFRWSAERHRVGAGETVVASAEVNVDEPFFQYPVDVHPVGSTDLPPIKRTLHLHNPSAETDWVTLKNDRLTVMFAPDGSGARVLRNGRPVAVLAPLDEAGPLKRYRAPHHLDLAERTEDSVTFRGTGSDRVRFELVGNTIRWALWSDYPRGGPVVRAVGGLEQGLLCGLEYLGEGEKSSSKLDIETKEHLRFAPDRVDVTMPLAAVVTDRASVALTWEKMDLQPIFATPNFFDGTPDHRMSVAGRDPYGAIRVGPGWQEGGRLEDAILWAARRRGLPEPPKPPRSLQEQWELCLKAYRGPLDGEGGWGHCAGDRWARRYFADHVSAIWRISGEVPDVPELVPGGAHISSQASYLVTGRARQWLLQMQRHARGVRQAQRDDGSFRYSGKYTRGHFEDTASGYCATRALPLLNHAYYTGNRDSLEAGLETLEYMKRFRTPRGAQTWELSLHTPDILASARLVKAYVRGYQMTGEREYLELARRWALTGLPFVYQWSDRPMMLYATTPVFGATNWRHNWIGKPVQWCGTDYADALLMLAPHDDTLDWRRVARGITGCGEQMQYPDGPSVGCLPDSVTLRTGRRNPADINPGALISLRLQLEGRLDGLDVAVGEGHRVVAPFPVYIANGTAHVKGETDVDYQMVIDGERIVAVSADGRDVIELQTGSAGDSQN